MLQDRFLKIMLVVIAALLAANLLRPSGKAQFILPIESTAQAQLVNTPTPAPPRRTSVKSVQGFNVTDLKEVVALGDGRTFVVSNPKGFMVYTVETQQ